MKIRKNNHNFPHLNGENNMDDITKKELEKNIGRKMASYVKKHANGIASYISSKYSNDDFLGDKEMIEEILESPVFLKYIRTEFPKSEEIQKQINEILKVDSGKNKIQEVLNQYPEIKSLLSLPHPWGDIEIERIQENRSLSKSEIFDKLILAIKKYHDIVSVEFPSYYSYSSILERFAITFSSIKEALDKSNWVEINNGNITTIPLHNICAYSIITVKEYLKRLGKPELFDLLKEISYLYSLYSGIKVSPFEVCISSLNIPLLVFIGFITVNDTNVKINEISEGKNLKLIINIPLVENLIKNDFSFIRKMIDYNVDEYKVRLSLNSNHTFTFRVLERQDEIIRVYTDLSYLSVLVDDVLLNPIKKDPKEYSKILNEEVLKETIQIPEYIPYAFSLIPYLYIDFNLSPSDEYTIEEIEEIRHNLREMSKLIDRVNYQSIKTKFDNVRTVNSYLKVKLNNDQIIVDLENVNLETRRLIYYMFKTVYPNSVFIVRDKLYTVEDAYDVKQDIKEILEKSFISLIIFRSKEVKPYLHYFEVFVKFLFNSPSQYIFEKIYKSNEEIKSPYTFILDLSNDEKFLGTIMDTGIDQNFHEYLYEYYEKSYKNVLKSLENATLEDYLLYIYNQFVDIFKEHILGLQNYDLIKKYEEYFNKKQSFGEEKYLITTEEILQKSLSDLFMYRSHFRDLDDLMEIKSGNLIVIGARPSIGKTSFALNYVLSLLTLHPDIKIGFISLETQKEYLGLRILQILLGLDKKALIDKYMKKDEEFEKTLEIINDYYLSRLIIVSNTYELSEIENIVEQMVKENKVNLIFVDYLQRMNVIVDKKNVSNTYIGITLSIKSFSTLSKKFNIPIFVLSQLNREIEKRKKNDVLLTDLKGSGDIEQEADIVILMNRNRVSVDVNDVEFNLIKNRDGKIGTINMLFKGSYFRFAPLDSKNMLEPDFYLNILKEKYEEYVNLKKQETININNYENYSDKVVYYCPVCKNYEREIKDGDVIVESLCDNCQSKGYKSYICVNCSNTTYNNTGDVLCENCKKFKDTIVSEFNTRHEIKISNPKELEDGYYTGLTIQCKICGNETLYFYKKYDLCPTCYRHLDKIYLTYGILNIVDPKNQTISEVFNKINNYISNHKIDNDNLIKAGKLIELIKDIDNIGKEIETLYKNKKFKDLYYLYIKRIYPSLINGNISEIYNYFKKTVDYLNNNNIKINFDHITYFGPIFMLPSKIIMSMDSIIENVKEINEIFYDKEKSSENKVYIKFLNDDDINKIGEIISNIKDKLNTISKFTKFIQINKEQITDYYNLLKEQILNEGNEFYNRYMLLNDRMLKLTNNIKHKIALNNILFALYYQYIKDKEFREMINNLTDEELLNTINILLMARYPYKMKNPDEITFYNLSDKITLEVLNINQIPEYVINIYEKIKYFLNHIGYNISLFENLKKETEKEENKSVKVYDIKTSKEGTMTTKDLKEIEKTHNIVEGNKIKFIRGVIKTFIFEELGIEEFMPKFYVSTWFNQFYKTSQKIIDLWDNAIKNKNWDEFNNFLKEVRNYDLPEYLHDFQLYINSYHSEINYNDIDEPLDQLYIQHYIRYLRSVKEVLNLIKNNKFINKGIMEKIKLETENMNYIIKSLKEHILNDLSLKKSQKENKNNDNNTNNNNDNNNGNEENNIVNIDTITEITEDKNIIKIEEPNYDISQIEEFEKESYYILKEIPLSEEEKIKVNVISNYLKEIIQCAYEYSYVITGLLNNYYDKFLIHFDIDINNAADEYKYRSTFLYQSFQSAIKYVNRIYSTKQKVLNKRKISEEHILTFYNNVHDYSKKVVIDDSIIPYRKEVLDIVRNNKELYLRSYKLVLEKIKDIEKYQPWYNILSVMHKFLNDSYDIFLSIGSILHNAYIDIVKLNSILAKEYDTKQLNKSFLDEIMSIISRIYENNKIFKSNVYDLQLSLSKYIKTFTESLKLFENIFFILEKNQNNNEYEYHPVLLKLVKELDLKRIDQNHLDVIKRFVDAHIKDGYQDIILSISSLNILRIFDSLTESNEIKNIQTIIDVFFREVNSRLYVPKWLEIYKYLFNYYKDEIVNYVKDRYDIENTEEFLNIFSDIFNSYEKSIDYIRVHKISNTNLLEYTQNEFFTSLFKNIERLKKLVKERKNVIEFEV